MSEHPMTYDEAADTLERWEVPQLAKRRRSRRTLALQLRFRRTSESIGHHDSEIMDDRGFSRDGAGAMGVFVAGCEGAHQTAVSAGPDGRFSRALSGCSAWS